MSAAPVEETPVATFARNRNGVSHSESSSSSQDNAIDKDKEELESPTSANANNSGPGAWSSNSNGNTANTVPPPPPPMLQRSSRRKLSTLDFQLRRRQLAQEARQRQLAHETASATTSASAASSSQHNNAENENNSITHTTNDNGLSDTNHLAIQQHHPARSNANKVTQENQTVKEKSHAVRSIYKGSAEWSGLLKPFVSDLAFRSVVSRRYQGAISFTPYNCQAALLFVDMSGYSKITAAIAHRGAHVMSSVVNAYLERLLHIIHRHGGDVIKFAGDAIIVIWEGDEQELEINVLCAARCVLELQQKAGEHAVDGTKHIFRIHCGLCCGPLESEIFEAPVHANMQRLYHSVGGETMAEIGDLVDLSKAGETCVSNNCLNFLEDMGLYQHIDDCGPALGAMLLTDLILEEDMIMLMEDHISNTMVARLARRNENIEEDFIHSNVLASLSHGGSAPTQIAQMRNLCVLFIAMTSKGNSVNWLMEVQAVLDCNQCPIVQIIDDDKGVHIVAAVNLYEAVGVGMCLLGLKVCRELVEKRVGATVGVATGPIFCGVTGCTTACRWDITGPGVVRAARLMQFALSKRVNFAIDQSVYDDPVAATHMTVLDASVSLKGTSTPIAVYTITDSKLHSAFQILENIHGGVHNAKVQEIQNHVGGYKDRCAVVVTGIPLAGKKIACQRAAGFSDLVPYRHICDESAGFLQLARTIATWFQYTDDMDVVNKARSVIEDMDKSCWSCAHDQCIDLVDLAIDKGFRACFVVDRIQFLDKFSLSLIRECLQTKGSSRQVSTSDDGFTMTGRDSDVWDATSNGKICFLCVHVSLYNWKSATDLVQDITRSHTSFSVPIVEIGEASLDELRTLFRDLWDMEVEDRWLETYAEASGYCAGYFIERAAAVRSLSSELWKDGKSALAETSKELVLHIPPGFIRQNKELTVTQIRAEIAMRFSQIYDELPPLCQMMLKTLTVATRQGFYKLPRRILWEVMNDLIANSAEDVLAILLGEMEEIALVKTELVYQVYVDENDGDTDEVISIQSPALADVAMDVCTPIQVRSIAAALIERLGAALTDNFQVSLVMAGLRNLLDRNEEIMKHLWLQAYDGFLQESESCGWDQYEIEKWMEIIDDEIHAAGFTSKDVLGGDFSVSVEPLKAISPGLSMLQYYSAPVSLGPLGHTLSVICRNTFHEFGAFHGASQEAIDKLHGSTGSACGRYLMEMMVLEDYLRENGFGAREGAVETEFDILSFLANPAGTGEEVETKVVMILDELIPRFVEPRLQRLYKLIYKLRQDNDTPAVFTFSQKAIRLAYEALQAPKCRTDAAQDALMILATMNWKPKSVPEYLPILHYQTVAQIRNKTLKRLNEMEVVMLRHQQTVDDLEVFLVVTPLLYEAHEQGLC
jgi:class 3 adenylate cyclase